MHSNVENTPLVGIENAVRETMKSVNTNALVLLKRQAEINRRIRDLHRVIRQLRRLAPNPKFDKKETLAVQRAPADDFGRREHHGLIKSPSPVQSRYSLSRACRIALLEGGPASLDEIRARILRRNSFSFPDATTMNITILRTLTRMAREGEILCLGRNSHKLWQRIERPTEVASDPDADPSA